MIKSPAVFMHGRAFDYRYTFVRIIHLWFC